MVDVMEPSEYRCPITHEIMQNPSSTSDGQTYEAEAIKAWFDAGNGTSPLTGLPLENKVLTPNIALRKAIESFLDGLPKREAHARQVSDLQARLEERERELQAAAAMTSEKSPLDNVAQALMVPRIEYERILAQLRLGRKRTHSQMAGVDMVASSQALEVPAESGSSSESGLPGEALVASRMEMLQQQKASIEESRVSAARDLEALESEVSACRTNLTVLETELAKEQLKAEMQRTKAAKLYEQLQTKEEALDNKGQELIEHAALLGIDGFEMLLQIRRNPAADCKGQLPCTYAQLLCEIIALRCEAQHALDAANVALDAAAVKRTLASGTIAKEVALKSHKAELRAHIAAADGQLASLAQSIEQVSGTSTELQTAAAWAPRLSSGVLTSSVHNLPMVLAVHRQHQTSSCLSMSAALSDLRARGRSWKELLAIGCSPAEMKAGGYTAMDAKDGGLTVMEIKQAGYTATEAKAAGCTAMEAKVGGYTAMEAREAGYTAMEAKEGGYSAMEAQAGGYTAMEAKGGGYTAMEAREAGYTSQDLYPLCKPISNEDMQDGVWILSLSDFGRLQSRDRDNRNPWGSTNSALWIGVIHYPSEQMQEIRVLRWSA